MARVGDSPQFPPGFCKGCGRPLGKLHANISCPMGSGIVRPEQVVQLGGLPPMVLDGHEVAQSRLTLFLYRLLRDTTPGSVEQYVTEFEAGSAAGEATVSNPFLFSYAENLASRLLKEARPIEEAREIVEAFIASDVEEVAPSDAERSVLQMKAENWLAEFGPKPIDLAGPNV